jgi:enoyl-CoA hydratase/carnithine racemase
MAGDAHKNVEECDVLGFTLQDGVYELTLDQAPCNELGTRMLAGLEGFLDSIDVKAAHALIIRSGLPTGFCAGADLRELYDGLNNTPEPERRPLLAAFLDRIHAVMDRLDMLPLITVGVISGICFGGGFELALTCDVLIAEKNARFAFPELRLGIIPGFGGIPRLKRDVGNAVIRDLLFTGRSINAKRARDFGLVSQVVPIGEGLTAARALTKQAAHYDAEARITAKRFLKPLPRAALQEEKEHFLRLASRPTLLAALQRFVESESVRPYLPS